ncbi:MAG: fumarylacetoacetate hydrolase family protein [Candidatus Dormibacteria bacterium]
MQLVTYVPRRSPLARGRAALLTPRGVVDISHASSGRLPATVLGLLELGEDLDAVLAGLGEATAIKREDVRLLAPLPGPVSLRDFMAFEDHVRHTRELRGASVPEAWYEAPVFYFSNHLAVLGPEDPVSAPPGCRALDYEFEVAVVIGREGRDIPEESGWAHVAGLMVMNDWSARDLQLREMQAGLGPAKGKDFATSMGPALVTMAEFEDRWDGAALSLQMTGRRNGVEFTRTNLNLIYHPVPRVIARASAGVNLRAGEVIGLGTVPYGCLLERADPDWLVAGDVVELEVEVLGTLRTEIVAGAGT